MYDFCYITFAALELSNAFLTLSLRAFAWQADGWVFDSQSRRPKCHIRFLHAKEPSPLNGHECRV